VKLDLQHNELWSIPHCILELPSLSELNLSHNKLTEIPDVQKWSSFLSELNLSHNQLTTMPPNTVAPTIRRLNLSHNAFRTVPLCICSFTTLLELDFSNNPNVQVLPKEMGRLTNLFWLHLRGLKNLKDPPKNMRRDTHDCIRYLNGKMKCAKSFYHMRLMPIEGRQHSQPDFKVGTVEMSPQ